jgi:hypothetical protein
MNNFTNISIYIKRAEMHHTKNYIIDSLLKNNYGVVKDVVFIKKCNDYGKEYNGAIVTFEKWFLNKKVTDLFNAINESSDETAKLIHDDYYNKYWIINIHKQEKQNIEDKSLIIDENLSDEEKINYLETLISSLTIKNKLLQQNQEKNEKKILELEQLNSREYLLNAELKIQLEEKDVLLEIQEEKNLKEKKELESIIEKLNFRNEILETNLNKKRKEYNDLKQDLYDEKCISNFIQQELYELKSVIHDKQIHQIERM